MTRSGRVWAAAFLLGGSAGCRDVTPSASTDAAARAPIDAAPTPVAPLDDLLHFTDARLAVSSRVDNPHDHPEDIADARLETAWNGKTGDLVGAWVRFQVPPETRVRVIELTAGYT